MSSKLKKSSAAARKSLISADEQIRRLKDKILPHDPHLLKIAGNTYPDRAIEEYKGTPFHNYEVRQLQYTTMINEDVRETLKPHGDWQEEVERNSPQNIAARSNTTTPNPRRDPSKPLKKMTLHDYKNKLKTSPKSGEAGQVNAQSRNSNAEASVTPMSRISSFDGNPEVRQNGTRPAPPPVTVEKPHNREHDRSAPPSARPHEGKDTTRPTTNGHAQRNTNSTLHSKDANKDPRSQRPESAQARRAPAKHALPPRPHSPPPKPTEMKNPAPEPRTQKRPLEPGAHTQPEKRARIEPTKPSVTSHPSLPRKPEHLNGNKLPAKPSSSQSTSARDSPSVRKTTPSTKPIDTGRTAPSTGEKPLRLPPLLSPLPADLDDNPIRDAFSSLKNTNSGKNSSQATPSKTKVGHDSGAPKKGHHNSSPLTTPPDSSSPFRPPRMLSPDLPECVEQELLKIQSRGEDKKAGAKKRPEESKSVLNSVEARHEKARHPDTPGVARKIVSTPRVGHPPKKTNGESSRSKQSVEDSEPTLIVKLKYPKRKRTDIQRILKLKGRPDEDFLRLEKERINKPSKPAEPEHKAASIASSASKAPSKATPSKIAEPERKPPPKTAGKTVASSSSGYASTSTSTAKKRQSDTFDHTPEPPTKRAKVNNIEVPKLKVSLESPFQSPPINNPSQKYLLATPKKGDAMKSVAMRKVDSSDGHARTPQANPISTPASAEKPRQNGTLNTNGQHSRPSSDISSSRSQSQSQFVIPLKMKREMDRILHLKDKGYDQNSMPDAQRKHGLSVGIECLVHYMDEFMEIDRTSPSRASGNWISGLSLWNYMDVQTKKFPALNALSHQVGAMYKEELQKAYVEQMEKELMSKDNDSATLGSSSSSSRGGPRLHQAMVANSKSRDQNWASASSMRGSLEKIGISPGEMMGPWMDGKAAMAYVERVLTAYGKKEGTGWAKFKDER